MKQMIEVMTAEDIDVVIIPEGEREEIVRELATRELTGAVVLRSTLVTDALKFNSVHVEIVKNFTILYH
jgi:hypothetical protein